jgi:hypothetical protein
LPFVRAKFWRKGPQAPLTSQQLAAHMERVRLGLENEESILPLVIYFSMMHFLYPKEFRKTRHEMLNEP